MVSLRRKIFFYIFVLLFFVLSFYVIAYAQGYRIKLSFPPSMGMIQKTGMILIKSNPSDALVYIDGQPRQSWLQKYLSDNSDYYKTPAKIKNLLPGEYELRLEKEGYHSWQEKIKIYPGKITILSNIHLFKEELPLKLSDYTFQKTSLSPNKKYLVNPKEKIIFDLQAQKEINFDPGLTTTSSEIKWSPDSEKFLYGQFLIHPATQEKNKNLSPVLPKKAETEWGTKGEKIYYQTPKSLNLLNLNEMKGEKLEEKKYSDFLIKENYLFLLENGANNRLLVKNLDNFQEYQAVRLPYSPGYKIKDFRNNLIHIYDNEYKILYLIQFDPPLLSLRETINNIEYFNWLDEKEIAYGNDFEIWSLDLEEKNKKLHGRLSEKIEGILAHPESRNIICYTDNNIKIIDLLEENEVNIIQLTQLNKISELFVGAEENDVYFNGEIGNQSGFYKLNIK